MRSTILWLATAASALVHPPSGAVYQRTVKLPVIGKQTIELQIISSTLARLNLSGRLKIVEPVQYAMDEDTGIFQFTLSPATKRILRKFRTSLCNAGWISDTDTAWVEVWPPLPVPIRIRLQRLQRERVSVRPRVTARVREVCMSWSRRARSRASEAAPGNV